VSAYTQILPTRVPRSEWLAARRSGLGSSDIAGVLGQSSWASPYSVWWDKVGPLQDTDGATESMRWGQRLEPVIAQVWSEQTGIRVKRIGLCRSNSRPWQLASPDRMTSDRGVLEVKIASGWDHDQWDADTIPLKYLLQTIHQMDVLGLDHGYLAVLIGGNELRAFDVPLDPVIVAVIRERGEQFWQLVQSRTAPPTDFHDATTAAVKARWAVPDEDGARVVLDPDWLDHLDGREWRKTDAGALTAACTATDNALREAIGAATHAICAGQLVATWKPRKDGVRVLNVIDSVKRKELTS